jgi:hypothetical protein
MQKKNHKDHKDQKTTIPLISSTNYPNKHENSNSYINNINHINCSPTPTMQDHKLEQFLMYHKQKNNNKDTSQLKNLITSYNLKSQVNIANYKKTNTKPKHLRMKSSKSDALCQTDDLFSTVVIKNDNEDNFNYDEKNLFLPGRKIFKIKGFNLDPKLIRSLKEEDYNVTQTIINTWSKKIGKFAKSKEKDSLMNRMSATATGNTFYSNKENLYLPDFSRIKSANYPNPHNFPKKKIRKEIIDINVRQFKKDIDVDKLVKPLNLMLISKNKFSQINNTINSNTITSVKTISSNAFSTDGMKKIYKETQNPKNSKNTKISQNIKIENNTGNDTPNANEELLRNSSSKENMLVSNENIVNNTRGSSLKDKRRRIKKNELDLLAIRPNFIVPEKVNPILDNKLRNFKTELKLNMRKVKDLQFALQSQQRKIDETIIHEIVKVRRDKNRIIKGNIFNVD